MNSHRHIIQAMIACRKDFQFIFLRCAQFIDVKLGNISSDMHALVSNTVVPYKTKLSWKVR